MEAIMLVLSLAVMTAIGYSVLRMITWREGGTYFPLEKAALSFALGMGCVAFGLLIFALAGVSFDLAKVLLPWGVVFIFSVLVVREKAGPAYAFPGEIVLRDRAGLFKVLAAIMGVQMISVFLRALVRPLEAYDAIVNFGIKSKMFFMYNGFPLKLSALSGAGAGHMDYPLLIPLNETWIYKFMGAQNDNLVMALFPIILVAFAVFFYYSLARFFGQKQAFLFTFLLSTVPQIVNSSTNGYADVAFTFMVTAAFVFLFRYFNEARRDLLILSAVFSGIGFNTKNEGISFILASCLLIAVFMHGEKDKRLHLGNIAVFYMVPLAVVMAPWILIKHSLGVSNSDIELSKLTASKFLDNVKHIPFILNKFQQEIFGPKKWNILWIAVVAFSVLRFRKSKDDRAWMIGIFILINLLIYLGSFMVLTGKDIYFHVNTTMPRLMMHFSGLSLFFLAFLLRDDIRDAFRAVESSPSGEKFVFLDRDGVINKDPAGWTPHSYVTKPEDFIILPRVLEAMKLFKDAGYETVIISNQQGVGKGFFTAEELVAVNASMVKRIKKAGGRVTGAYYCTHLTEQGCGCKKPKPGMFLKAQEELGIKELAGKYFVGDTERDIQAGKGAGLRTILVLSGKSKREDAEKWEYKPDIICDDLLEAARVIVGENQRGQ